MIPSGSPSRALRSGGPRETAVKARGDLGRRVRTRAEPQCGVPAPSKLRSTSTGDGRAASNGSARAALSGWSTARPKPARTRVAGPRSIPWTARGTRDPAASVGHLGSMCPAMGAALNGTRTRTSHAVLRIQESPAAGECGTPRLKSRSATRVGPGFWMALDSLESTLANHISYDPWRGIRYE